MRLFLSTLLLLLPLLLPTTANADTNSEIHQLVVDNMKHTQAEDINAVMQTMHSQSPAYQITKRVLEQLVQNYDLHYELLNYQFIAEDDEYAYAKVKQKAEKVSGLAFQNNELEALVVFKQENGQWKLWTQANLTILFL